MMCVLSVLVPFLRAFCFHVYSYMHHVVFVRYKRFYEAVF